MKFSKGFTLIELVIVVAILGILLSIVISAIRAHPFNSDGSNSRTTPDVASVLVCKDANGAVVKSTPANPGQTWSFEGGVYVTYDYNGNPITQAPSGAGCSVEH
jgi:prepilin-type N-terminal cleavage/methylation domain-containing protein